MVVLNRNVLSELYPIDYITYEGAGPEVKKSITNTKKMGFHILKVTPDNYNVPEEVKAGHAGFKHMKEITLPKILRLKQKKKSVRCNTTKRTQPRRDKKLESCMLLRGSPCRSATR